MATAAVKPEPGSAGAVLVCRYPHGVRHLSIAPGRPAKLAIRLGEPWCRGWFSHHEGRLLALYRCADKLWWRDGDQERVLSEQVTASWQQQPDERAHFELHDGDELLLSVHYRQPINWLDRQDPGFNAGEKDFFYAIYRKLRGPEERAQAFV